MKRALLLSMLAVVFTVFSAPAARADFLDELEGASYMEEGIVYAKIGERD